MYSYGRPHMAGQKQDDQHEHTFSSYVWIRDVVLKTYLGLWTIGRSGVRGSGISVLVAQHDDNDDIQFNNSHLQVNIHRTLKGVIALGLSWRRSNGNEKYFSCFHDTYRRLVGNGIWPICRNAVGYMYICIYLLFKYKIKYSWIHTPTHINRCYKAYSLVDICLH